MTLATPILNLDAELAGLTRPSANRANEEPWRRAAAARGWVRVHAAGEDGERSMTASAGARPRTRGAQLFAAAGLVLVVVVLVGLTLPALSKARKSARQSVGGDESRAYLEAKSIRAFSQPASPASSFNAPGDARVEELPGAARSGPTPDAFATPRLVVRKAALDLRVASVFAAYARIAPMLSEVRGEFVQEAALRAPRDGGSATLTLRVEPARVATILTGLRDLGEVISETTGGEDVTDQMVDLEARIRNDQRVETELIGLLAARKDAPLSEILSLRDALGRVRQSIERMAAQRDRVGKLVALATITVTLQEVAAAPNPDAAKPAGIGARFGAAATRGWNSFTSMAIDLTEFVISGLAVWIILAVAVVVAIPLVRRLQRRLADEPPPFSSGPGA
ncbi:hypothetical protein BH11PLA1_BH11PLA1_16540 [soil metagenome]